MRISFTTRLLLSASLALLSGVSHAEKTDSQQPVNIESDRMTADDNKKISYFEGNVILDQGTIHLTADHMTVREDPQGMKYASAFGNPVTFRQKRDGVDEWMDGVAQHAEYNGKLERVELFEHAVVHQGKDEIKGDYLSYDLKTEFLRANGTAQDQGTNPVKSRVHVVFQPKKDDGKGDQKGQPASSSVPAPVARPQNGESYSPLQLQQDMEVVP